MSPSTVANEMIAAHAAGLAAAPSVGRAELALAFDQSKASSVELHVEGRNFYPSLLADIAAASSSVHINQFGFRPGLVGDRFADVLVAKAAEGVPVRLIVDRQGTDPERGSRELYQRLTAAGIVIAAALSLMDIATVAKFLRVRTSAFMLAMTATLGVVFFGVLEGILACSAGWPATPAVRAA